MTAVAADSAAVWVGFADQPVPEQFAIRFLIAFCDDLAPHSVETESDAIGNAVHRISRQWAVIGDDFGQQLLNRSFAQLLLRHRPATVHVDRVCGATLDFLNLAPLFGVSTTVSDVPDVVVPQSGTRARAWFEAALAHCSSSLEPGQRRADRQAGAADPGYEAYAFGQRDHGLLYRMQESLVTHFSGCRTVLDVGCGTGLFLEAIDRAGITPVGVERNAMSARYAEGLGHRVVEMGAFDFLESTDERFDGIYCSHFVEHLPIEGVEKLIRLIVRVLRPGGVALFVFPDPESIRSQLLGFWRDPEHVRFYHPDLVELICSMHGLDCEFHSQRVAGRRIVPFEMEPTLSPPAAASGLPEFPPRGRLDALLRCFGLAPGRRVDMLERAVVDLGNRLRKLESNAHEVDDAVRSLWNVNQTWSWDDNATLRFRK